MDLGSILNSDSWSSSRAGGFWMNASSYPKAPTRTATRSKSESQEVQNGRPKRLSTTGETSCRTNPASVQTQAGTHAPSKVQRSGSQRAESVQFDAAALQSLSLGSDQHSALSQRPSSIQSSDQRSKYHRSTYGTSSTSSSQAHRDTSFGHAFTGAHISTSHSHSPSHLANQTRAWRVNGPLPSSQSYWSEGHRSTASKLHVLLLSQARCPTFDACQS